MHYSFNPFSRQYLFPENFQRHDLFKNFYHPRKPLAKILWWVWNRFSILRFFGAMKEVDHCLYSPVLVGLIPKDSEVAYNLGTKGPEQKLTALGLSTLEGPFFIKFSLTDVARKNVDNEAFTLFQLQESSLVPVVRQYKSTPDFSFLMTNVFSGKTLQNNKLTDRILSILFMIGEQDVKSNSREYKSNYFTLFAHGDFCPWNIMNCGDELKVFDWELAGIYPVGYDLFTFLFQPEHLVNRKTRFSQIISENETNIRGYFDHWGINDWKPYMSEFAKLKIRLEDEKNGGGLLNFYKKLLVYAASI